MNKQKECLVCTTSQGYKIIVPAFPQECEYIRIENPQGKEVAYWYYNEWQEDPKLVMGAITGLINTLD